MFRKMLGFLTARFLRFTALLARLESRTNGMDVANLERRLPTTGAGEPPTSHGGRAGRRSGNVTAGAVYSVVVSTLAVALEHCAIAFVKLLLLVNDRLEIA